MSTLGKITRRTFLVGSAAVAGGVAFGVYRTKTPYPNPLAEATDGSTGLTEYLKIDADGISIVAPRGEMGQGVQSSLAAFVAEELDVAWDAIKIIHGPAAPVYYNGAVMAEALPGVSALDKGKTAETMRSVGGAAGKLLQMQITGGSSSMTDGFMKMRKAGAAARLALIDAAAEIHGVDAGAIQTDNGFVVLPSGERIDYRELAPRAATSAINPDPPLRPQSEWRYIGKSMPRFDVLPKSTGTAVYGIDVQLDDMLFATVRANPRLSGGARAVDTAKARELRGVVDIFEISTGVAVVADNTWRAFNAAKKLDIDWDPSPYSKSTSELFDALGRAVDKNKKNSRLRDDGDVDAELDALTAIEAEYRAPALAHAPLEPMNATVRFAEGEADIWVGTQVPLHAKKRAADILGIDSDRVRVHTLFMGGSFGRRLEIDFIEQAVEVAKNVPGKPVKLTWTREEDMSHDYVRPPAIGRMRGAVKDGKVVAMDAHLSHISVTASWMPRLTGLPAAGPDPMVVQGAWDQPYGIPNYRVAGYTPGDILPVSSWRSVGASSNGFLSEGFLDELIVAAGADPFEERLRLMTDESSRRVLERLKEISAWSGPVEPGRGYGRGVASVYSFGVPAAAVVDISESPRGIRLDKISIVLDVGTIIDPDNVKAQVMGGALWGIGHAILGEITHTDGIVDQTNFHQFDGIRMPQVPEVVIDILEFQETVRGVGEPAVPPMAPALTAAIYSMTGQRLRELPLRKSIKFA